MQILIEKIVLKVSKLKNFLKKLEEFELSENEKWKWTFWTSCVIIIGWDTMNI